MSKIIKTLFGFIAAITIMFGIAGAAAAEDCPRGHLDKAYCDRNGDLVADTPTDAKQLVNPSTLIFSYTPVEDPAVYEKVWDGFIKHMEKVTGKKVVFFPVQSECRATTRRCARAGCMSPASTPAAIRSRSTAPASCRSR